MGRYQVFRKDGTNPAALAFGASKAARSTTFLKIRMTELEEYRYGACNILRINNKSTQKARIHFTWGIDDQRYEDLEANSIRNVEIEDGMRFYGFDVENLSTTTDIAIGEIQFTMAKVMED